MFKMKMKSNGEEFAKILVLIILVFFLLKYSSLFAINLSSPYVQYYNHPIEAVFETDLSDVTIKAYFNEVELFTSGSASNQSISRYFYTKEKVNNTWRLKLYNVSQEGLFKFVVIHPNKTESQVIEVRKPFVDIRHNIETTLDRGASRTIEISTFNPQGEKISVDSIDMDVYGPDNRVVTINLLRSNETNTFTTLFNYDKVGSYQFRIHPRKDGYETKEFIVITNVLKTEGIHPIIWVWFGAIILWLTLFAVKLFRRLR